MLNKDGEHLASLCCHFEHYGMLMLAFSKENDALISHKIVVYVIHVVMNEVV